jgi:hypothetical protein
MITHQCEIDVVSRIPNENLVIVYPECCMEYFVTQGRLAKLLRGYFDLSSYIYVPNLEREIGRLNLVMVLLLNLSLMLGNTIS